MAISDSKKLDYLWKKLGYGVTKTDDSDKKSASNENIASPLLIRGDRIWTESDQIPNIAPQTSSDIVQVHADYISNTVQCIEDNTSSPLRSWKTSLTDWIPGEFGSTYAVKVYVDDPGEINSMETGTRLFPDGTGDDEWFFDYSSGVLHFIGETLPSPVINGKVIYISGARYVGVFGLSNTDTLSSSSGELILSSTIPEGETFFADGNLVTYILSHTPSSPEAIDVYVNDVLQRPEEIYTLQDGNILRFSETPVVDTEVYVKYRYPFATLVDNLDNSIENRHLDLNYNSDQYNGDGDQQIYDINPGHNEHSVLVVVDGLILPPQHYNVNGTVLTLTTQPAPDAIIDIRYMPV
jgi:hypothetical protein